jgi:hypothetical protein
MVYKKIRKKDSGVDVKIDGGKQGTLSDFGFITKITKAIKKIKKLREDNQCNYKAVIICGCGYFKNFYCCLYALEDYILNCFLKCCPDYPNCDGCDSLFDCLLEARDEVNALLYGEIYDENGEIEYTEVKPVLWKENNYWLGKCECKPIRTIDGEITEREYLNELSKHEPCKFRCKYFQKLGECKFEKIKNLDNRKQKKVDRYLHKKNSFNV